MQITIYKTPDCPRCRELAAYLRGLGIDFEEQDMSHPAVITDLRCDNVFALAAPVLRVGDDYLAGLRRAEREGPTLQGGDESGALCPRIRLWITI